MHSQSEETFYELRRANGHLYLGTHGPSEVGYYKKHPLWVKKAILRAAKGGEMTIRDMTRHWGVNERTISRWCREAGLPPRVSPEAQRAGLTPDDIFEKALAMFRTTVAIEEIALLLNVGTINAHTTVLRKLKTELRRRGLPDKLPTKPRSDLATLGTWNTKYPREKVLGWHEKRLRGVPWKQIVPLDELVSSRQVYYDRRYRNPEWFKEAT